MASKRKPCREFDVGVTGTDHDKLRVVVVLDRVRGTAFAAILNEQNNRWAPLTDGEHDIADANDYDECFDSINECCNDIMRWSEDQDG